MTERLAASRDPLVGVLIDGRYLVQGVIGRGGMGVVYAAVHEELQRAVAVKVLNPAWASDADASARFLREARVASSLSHANIVDVWDLGRLPDGRPYLVMPRIAGEDLGTLLAEEGPQHPRRVVKLLEGVAAALDLIHAKGFVHRDIKPENLLRVVREDGSEAVLVLDFGIAAAVLSESRFTKDGVLCGTPDFLPPEVVSGELPDRRGDVYALATVAFELMTGRLPFQGVNPFQLLTLKLAQPAPTLTSAGGRVFPEALEHVIARGLAQDPRERYGTAGEFIHALATAAQQAQDELPDLSTADTARQPVRQSAFIRRPPRAPDEPPRKERAGPPQVLIVDEDADLEALLPRRTGGRETAFLLLALALIGGGVYFTLRERESQLAERAAPAAATPPASAGASPGAVEAAASSLPARAPEPSVALAASSPGEPAAPAVQPPARTVRDEPADSPPAAPSPDPRAAEARPRAERVPRRDSRRERPEQTVEGEQEPAGAAPAAVPGAPAPPAPELPVISIAPSAADPDSPPAAEAPALQPALPDAPSASAAPSEPQKPAEPARDPERARGLSERATQAMLQGQLTSALGLFQRAVQADSSHAPAWRGRGLVLQQLGRPREAARALREFLRLSPDGAQSQMIRERLRSIEEANELRVGDL